MVIHISGIRTWECRAGDHPARDPHESEIHQFAVWPSLEDLLQGGTENLQWLLSRNAVSSSQYNFLHKQCRMDESRTAWVRNGARFIVNHATSVRQRFTCAYPSGSNSPAVELIPV